MEVVLIMFKADGQKRSFPLQRDIMVIGRREDCDLRIPLTEVSRKHCRLVKEKANQVLRLEDLGSSNGTYHNGQRVQESQMHAGDYFQVGPVIFAVQINGEPAEDLIQPPQLHAEEQEPAQDEQYVARAENPSANTSADSDGPIMMPDDIGGETDRPSSPIPMQRPEAPSTSNPDDEFVIQMDEPDVKVDEDLIDMGEEPAPPKPHRK